MKRHISCAEGWACREYLKGPYASKVVDVERKVKEKRLGLWKQDNTELPRQF